MIIVGVAFVLINIAVPYWVWTSKTADKQPKVEHQVLRQALHELSEASGGFAPCETADVVEAIDELCEKSRLRYKDGASVAFEQAAVDVVFSCEVQKSQIKVQWFPERADGNADLQCEADRDELMAFGPTFVFSLQGKIRRIEYTGLDGKRQAAPMRNCRAKLRTARALASVPSNSEEFVTILGRMPGDPPDHLTENLICLGFDPHPEWDKWRRRYQK